MVFIHFRLVVRLAFKLVGIAVKLDNRVNLSDKKPRCFAMRPFPAGYGDVR